MDVAEDDEVASATGGSGAEDVRARKWFYGEKDAPPSGPVGFERVAQMWGQGTITGATHVWSTGMSKQERVSRMPELLEALGPAPQALAPAARESLDEDEVKESPIAASTTVPAVEGAEGAARRRPPPPPIGAVTAVPSPGQTDSDTEGIASPPVRSPGIFGAARASIFLDRLRSSLTRKESGGKSSSESGASTPSPGRGGALEVAGSPSLDSNAADEPAASAEADEGVEESEPLVGGEPLAESMPREGGAEEAAPAPDEAATPQQGTPEMSTPAPVSVAVDVSKVDPSADDDNEIFLMLEELAEEEAAEEKLLAQARAPPATPAVHRSLTIDVGRGNSARGIVEEGRGEKEVEEERAVLLPAQGPEDATKLDVDALEVEVNRVYKQNSDIIERLKSPEALLREGRGDATPRGLGTGGRVSPRLLAASARLRDEELESAKGYTVMLEEECERLRGQNRALVEAVSDQATISARRDGDGDGEEEWSGGPLEAMVRQYIRHETKATLVEALSRQRPGQGGADRARQSELEFKVAHLAELLEVMARELDESGSMLKDYEATRHRCRALEQQLDTLRSANRDLVKRSARSAATSARHASMMRSASAGRLSRPSTDSLARSRGISSPSSASGQRSLTPSGLRRPTPPKLAFGRPIPPAPQRSESAERRRTSTPSTSRPPTGLRLAKTSASSSPASTPSGVPLSGDFYRPARMRTGSSVGKERQQPRRSQSTPRPPARALDRQTPTMAIKADWHDRGLDKPLSPDMSPKNAFSRVTTMKKPSPAAIVGHLDSMVDLLRTRFKDNGLVLTLARAKEAPGSPNAGPKPERVKTAGVLYTIGEGRAQRKVYLNIKDGKLVLKTGGGYVDFIDYLSRNARSLGIKPAGGGE